MICDNDDFEPPTTKYKPMKDLYPDDAEYYTKSKTYIDVVFIVPHSDIVE